MINNMIFRSLKKFHLIFFIFSFSSLTYAQQSGSVDIIPPSPEAASIARYGDVPVSLYNGSANIGIPLYTLASRDLSVPISLSYNSRGIKVEEDASWVGLGWTLNAGGAITRSIRGIDDFSDGNTANGFYANRRGFIYSEAAPEPTSTSIRTSLIQDYSDGRQDSNPDIFYYNFNGYSGKFILKQKTLPASQSDPIEVVMLSDDKMQISYNEVTKFWTFVTIDGTTYTFGTTETAESWQAFGRSSVGLDNTRTARDPYEVDPITAWYLDEVTSQKGQVINFNYSSIADDYSTSVYSFSEKFNMGLNPGSGTSCSTPTTFTPTGTVTGTIVRYLESIEINTADSPIGQPVVITFHHSEREDIRPYDETSPFGDGLSTHARARKLDRITVEESSDGSMNLIKDIRFTYTVLNSGVLTSLEHLEIGKRLQLDAVSFYESGSSIAKYDLEYNTDTSLPHKNSHEIDYWGYYNAAGPSPNNSKIPEMTFQFYDGNAVQDFLSIPGANRKPNEEATKARILEKITYPSGGSTSFEYELNDFFDTEYSNLGGTVGKPITIEQVGTGTKVFEVTETVNATVISSIINTDMTCYDDSTPFPPDLPLGEGDAAVLSVAGSISNISGLDYSMLECVPNPTHMSCTDVEFIGYGPCGIRRINQITLTPGIYVVEVNNFEEWQPEISVSFEHPISVVDDINLGRGEGAGLRVKKITDHDGISTENDVVRTFDYSITQPSGQVTSSGKLITVPQHSYISQSVVAQTIQLTFAALNILNVCSDLSIVSYSTRPFSNAAAGAGIGYSKVTETFGKHGEGGYTEFTYINIPDLETTSIDEDFIPNAPTTDYAYKNGALKTETRYDFSGNPVLRLTNLYSETVVETNSYMYWFITSGTPPSFGGVSHVSYSSIDLFYHKFYEIRDVFHELASTRRTEWFYDEGAVSSQSQFTTYTHSLNHRLELTSQTGDPVIADNDLIRSEVLYAEDVGDEGQALRDRHMHNLPVETSSLLNGEKISGMKYVYTAHSDKSDMVLLDQIQVYNTDTEDFEARTSFTYDTYGNLIEVNQDGRITSFLWGDRHSLVLAKGDNIHHADLESASDAGHDLQTYFEDGLVTEYAHLPYVGLERITQSTGLYQQYEFDEHGRLLKIKDQSDNILFSFEYNYQNK